ncbi:hypothetical protein GCM10017557_12520 [Streptomyces aurantiacus]|uniref:Uncharacterized protein n=1 Tax=Streptomyces aurantiacus TaxID=47760 RepID=A0A7G1NSZ4_9ACTN|nr:hypothetical protein GCM10017557_12520 [Streptomyces aurantiacus]
MGTQEHTRATAYKSDCRRGRAGDVPPSVAALRGVLRDTPVWATTGRCAWSAGRRKYLVVSSTADVPTVIEASPRPFGADRAQGL